MDFAIHHHRLTVGHIHTVYRSAIFRKLNGDVHCHCVAVCHLNQCKWSNGAIAPLYSFRIVSFAFVDTVRNSCMLYRTAMLTSSTNSEFETSESQFILNFLFPYKKYAIHICDGIFRFVLRTHA